MKKEVTILSAVLLCASLAFGSISDTFDGDILDATLWNTDIVGGMTVTEVGGQLQIMSPGIEGESGIELNQLLTGWFDLSIDFNSSGCTENSVLSVNIEDNTGTYSYSFINGTIDGTRLWAILDSNDDLNPFLFQATTTDDSGTFFVGYDDEEANGTLYFSSDGESYLYSVTGVNDWGVTGFNVSFTLADLGSSGATGSFDNFSVVPEPAVAMLFGAGGIGLIVLRHRISRQ
jgi:hypothetical protein